MIVTVTVWTIMQLHLGHDSDRVDDSVSAALNGEPNFGFRCDAYTKKCWCPAEKFIDAGGEARKLALQNV